MDKRARLILSLDEQCATSFASVNGDGAIRAHEKMSYAQSNMVRMQRALSWLKREHELGGSDPDVSFILLWIALESLYNSDSNQEISVVAGKGRSSAPLSTSAKIMDFLNKLELIEEGRLRIERASLEVWDEVMELFQNPFISDSNWSKYYKGTTKAGPKKNPFNVGKPKLKKSSLHNTVQLNEYLKELFRRLYMMRNQLFHGNATYKGDDEGRRTSQIMHAAVVMRTLLPELVGILLDRFEDDTERRDLGIIPYPRIKD